MYKGFIPKVLRLAPGGGVLLLVVEFTLGVFRKGKVILFFLWAYRFCVDDHGFSTWTSVYIASIAKESGTVLSLFPHMQKLYIDFVGGAYNNRFMDFRISGMYCACQSDEVLNNNLCCNNLVTGDECKHSKLYFEVS